MKINPDFIPVSFLGGSTVLAIFGYRNGVLNVPFFLLVISLLVVFGFIMWNIRKKSRIKENDDRTRSDDIADPKLLRSDLLAYCRSNMANFRTVPELLTVPGPRPAHSSISVVPPPELDLYFETIENPSSIQVDIIEFFVDNAGCEIVGRKGDGGAGSRLRSFEARKNGRYGRYLVVVSEVERIPLHFRIQVTRIFPAAA